MIDALIATAVLERFVPEYPVPAVYQAFEACVAERESNNNPLVVNHSGHMGLYQFTDGLADGATWHMIPWLATWHDKPRAYAKFLRQLPMNKWPAEVQTAAFVVTLDGHDKKERWAGVKHWFGGRWYCGPHGRG